ncbi:3558ee7c-dce4-4a6d-825b-56730484ea1f [Thermothielavioides terrestris]|uniref:3558ee7c-dce4-4a6d-825b-56730484ea1f n=1 Tax=Thermothielavioides terrestris TaxID=2587410 RepID=A0A3S4AMM0_9PEZI|nr:3558ee7c-dce4-4a6d-825b-56730484ea1f [Thermothielavioides terrestris]
MDLTSLKNTVSNLTLCDIKAGVRKVREATNNEPWGASSTQMQEIADGTFNYQTLNEIMPMIYRRFTEKSAEEWRQIYKALQLLEYLIKHGSERVIDDARSHITLLKMLRQFHYIDQNGKDQGVNVRHRAKELAELLSDVDRIRAERKKARANKGKFTSMQGGGGFGSSSRYGGFGSDSAYGGGSTSTYGGYAGGVYGDGGGFGGQSDEFRGSQSRPDKFEEYDEFDEGERPTAASTRSPRTTRDTAERVGVNRTTEPPKKKEPEVDLVDFDEPAAPAAPAVAPPKASGLSSLDSGANDDDEFDDFQSATPATQTSGPAASSTSSLPPPLGASTLPLAAPKPVSAPQQANLSGMVAKSSISPPPSSTASPAGNLSAFSTPLTATTLSPATQAPKPAGFQAATPNYFSPVQPVGSSTVGGAKAAGGPTSAKPAAGGDAFGALWSQASVGLKKNTQTGPAQVFGAPRAVVWDQLSRRQ